MARCSMAFCMSGVQSDVAVPYKEVYQEVYTMRTVWTLNYSTRL